MKLWGLALRGIYTSVDIYKYVIEDIQRGMGKEREYPRFNFLGVYWQFLRESDSLMRRQITCQAKEIILAWGR